MSAPLVLIAEDEIALRDLLAYTLEREGFAVCCAGDGRQALTLAAKAPHPDLLLLDWMLPGPSGIDVCKRLRRNARLKSMPIIMLTARSEENDRILGLNSGADDYITKPFSTKELIARIHALLRRARSHLDSEIIQCGKIEINKTAHKASCNNKHIALSPTEFKLLLHLAGRPDHIFTRESLIHAIWGSDHHIEARTVDANIKRLRSQIKKTCDHDPIRTVRGIGYVFEN